MKVLLIGSGGMLGHMTTLYFQELGYEIVDISHNRRCREATVLIDILDRRKFEDFLAKSEFDYVINCAAVLVKASLQKKAEAIMLNSWFPHYLEGIFSDTGTKLIQVSTAGVFAGNSAPYCEEDLQDTNTFYGKTKSLGELENAKNLVIRSDFIGPDMSKQGTGLFNWIMTAGKELVGYSRAIFNGVSSLEFAKFLDFAIKNNITGQYHLFAADSLSKADFIRAVSKVFHLGISVADADRVTIDTRLCTHRTDVNYSQKTYEQQLTELKEWVETHRSLYPHYDL